MRRWLWPLLLVLCALVGLTARLWNVDFDQRQQLQPDERFWSITANNLAAAHAPDAHGTLAGPVLDWLDGDRSPANVYRGVDSFPYGPITLAAARGAAGWLHDGVASDDQPASMVAHAINALGVPLINDQGDPRFDDAYEVDLVGRLLGALLDAVTIVIVGLIGRRLSGRRAGIVGAALYATCVMAIQHAHFLGAEPVVAFASALTVLATLRLDRSSRVAVAVRGGALVGAAAGLAVGAKLTGAAVAVVPVLLCSWLVYRHRRRADLARVLSVALAAIVTFRVVNPGAFEGLGWSLKQQFVDDFWASVRVADSDSPPAVQWANRIVVIDALRWLFVYTVGPGAFLGAAAGAAALWRRRSHIACWNIAVAYAALVIPALLVLRSFSPTGRYFMAILPTLHAVAGVGLVALWAHRPHLAPAVRRRTGPVLAVALASAALLWGAAFVNGVYGHDNTRIVASRWIQANVPEGSVLSSEAWDDALPISVDGIDGRAWTNEQFDLFGEDTVEKVERLATQLTGVDYVVESSPRVWGTVTRIPVRYPSTIKFFAALDTGQLGFERVATFTSVPRISLFGVQLWRHDDSNAEEAFSVYDHPEVRIWKRVRDLPADELLQVLDPAAASTAIHVSPQNAHANGLMLFADEVAANETVGTYDDDFDTTGSPWWHLLGWLLLVEASGVAAFVIFLPLLRRFPDAGAGVSKMLGVALPAVAVFVAVTWLGVAFTREAVAAVFAAWFVAAIVLGRRRAAQLAAVWAQRRRTIVLAAALSTLTFLVFVALRAMNPDLWHPSRAGEKPFELTVLTSVMRTRTLPPYDSWMSDGTLNYYYGGYLMLSLPGRLLRTSPTVVMNLAVALLASCTAGAALTAGSAVVSSGRIVASKASLTMARWSGLLAAGFVLLLPNMAIVPDVVRRMVGAEHGTFDWWSPSRVIPNSAAITEFPAWSLLFGDVHPHVMGLPLLTSVMVLCLAWYRSLMERRSAQSIALAVVVGLLLGLVRATNTWDFPLALATALLAVSVALVRRGNWRVAARDVVAAGAGVVLVWAPYAWRGEVYDAGVEPVTQRTPWESWLDHWAFFAACTLLVAVPVVWRWTSHRVRTSPAMWRSVRNVHVVALAVAFIAVGVFMLAPSRFTQLTCVGLAALAAAAAVIGRRRKSVPSLGCALMALGWLVIVVIEQYSVKNDGGRMNTVFKGWYQAWLLLAIGSAVSLVVLVRSRALATSWRPQLYRRTGVAFVAFAGVVAVAFAVLATPVRLDDRLSPDGLSLDGMAYFESGLRYGDSDRLLADDLPLLKWLQANVHGIVPIAEAPGDDYVWSSRFATMTGLPTPIGWPYHERQQKRDYGYLVDQRIADMKELYTTTDSRRAAELLARYRLHYITFGLVEQRLSPDPTGATLLAGPCVREVFRSGDLFVAEVDRQCLRELPPRE
ncbi:MAG: DUF2298 domain-containing protein [Ilumatobacteraceae bacterium]|nr:DUF2298 domain-containing protein [Ilumatobacteraceae bacterium]